MSRTVEKTTLISEDYKYLLFRITNIVSVILCILIRYQFNISLLYPLLSNSLFKTNFKYTFRIRYIK